jgi:hypothetical protein
MCFTTALLLLYYDCGWDSVLYVLYYCFTTALLLLYYDCGWDSALYVLCNADIHIIYIRASTQKLTNIIGLTTAAHQGRVKAQTRKPFFLEELFFLGKCFFRKSGNTYTKKMRQISTRESYAAAT